jgi:peptidoglycan/xylan/chitin deacetylase (PgdA/CDA1 family)
MRRGKLRLENRAKLTVLIAMCVLACTGWAGAAKAPQRGVGAGSPFSDQRISQAEGRARGIVWSVPTREKVVALTFDDGPDPVHTPQVLKLAREKGIKLTFFLVGSQVRRYPDLARQEMAAGHAIGNHTWDHRLMTRETETEVQAEIERCQDEIQKVCGQRTRLLRPPWGQWDGNTLLGAHALGYRIVLWSMTLNYESAKTARDKAERILRNIRPGMIILAHDGQLSGPGDLRVIMRALPILVDGLRHKGYRFVTVPELLAMAGAKRPGAIAAGGPAERRPAGLPSPLRGGGSPVRSG